MKAIELAINASGSVRVTTRLTVEDGRGTEFRRTEQGANRHYSRGDARRGWHATGRATHVHDSGEGRVRAEYVRSQPALCF